MKHISFRQLHRALAHGLSRVLWPLRIRRNERWVALAVALCVAALNALVIYCYCDKFTLPAPQGFHGLILNNFHVSGFDAHSIIVLSCEDI